MGMYAGSPIPAEMHLDINHAEVNRIGEEVVHSLKHFVQDPDEQIKLTRRNILHRKINQKIEEMKFKINLIDGTNAMQKYHVDARELTREKKLHKKYDKNPLANPDYIKKAKADPQSEY